jgi:hypothetical protein
MYSRARPRSARREPRVRAPETFTSVENPLEEQAYNVQDALNCLTLDRFLPRLRQNLVEIGLRKLQRLPDRESAN